MHSKPKLSLAPDANVIVNSVVKEDPYIECPYNKSHQILKSRIQYHLVKCKKQTSEQKRLVCPFDATHHITRSDWIIHIQNCPNRKLVDALSYQVGNYTKSYEEWKNVPPAEIKESWEDNSAPAYNPFQSTQNAPVIRFIIGATKAERKSFRKCERKRMEEILNKKHQM